MILMPSDPDGPRRALSRVHRRYAGFIHARHKKTGHFWQRRYGSVVMDETHLAAALRYVTLNPVRARLVERAQDWRWSSVRAHLTGVGDGVTCLAPVRDRFPSFAGLLDDSEFDTLTSALRSAETIGRPVGSPAFLGQLEATTRRALSPRPRGPKPRAPAGGSIGGSY
jgi:putative transposase